MRRKIKDSMPKKGIHIIRFGKMGGSWIARLLIEKRSVPCFLFQMLITDWKFVKS